MMKMGLAIAVSVITAASLSYGDITQSWGAQSSGAYLYDSTGTILDNLSSDYQIQLVIDVNGDTDMTALMSGYIGLNGDANGWDTYMDTSATDDVVHSIDMRNWQHLAGGLYGLVEAPSQVADTYAQTPFYFRWFNSDSQASATEAGIIYGTGGSGNLSGFVFGDPPPAGTQPAVELDYASGGSAGTAFTAGVNDGWQTIQPIPEPGTIGLFIIGAGVLAYRKRRQAQQTMIQA